MKEVLLGTDTVSFYLKGIPNVKSKFDATYAGFVGIGREGADIVRYIPT